MRYKFAVGRHSLIEKRLNAMSLSEFEEAIPVNAERDKLAKLRGL